MNKLDDRIPNLGLIPAMGIVSVLGILLQLLGHWSLMLLAGFVGALFTRKSKVSFLAGFAGVAIAWTVLFAYLALTAQALAIANLFIGLLGLDGLGWLVLTISILVGGCLGGSGGLFGRALIEAVDEYLLVSQD